MTRRMLAIIVVFLSVTFAFAGTWTSNNFLYKPATGARGEGEQKIFESGLERVDQRLGKEIWVGDPGYGTTLQDAIIGIGSNQASLRIPAGAWNVAANFTIPANITLKPERGAILNISSGVTLSINGELDAGDYQIFTWTGTGAVSFTSQAKIKTAWFGNTAAGINKALTSRPAKNPVVCELPGGTIALGTTSIVMQGEGQTLQGQGNNFAGESYYGTRLTYSGTGYAIEMGKVGTFTTHAALKDFMLDGENIGAKGIRVGFVDPGWAVYPYMENVTVRKFTGNGADVYGAEYGIFRRCQFSYNDGAGMVVGPTAILMEGGNLNRVESCSFSYNKQEGLLFKIGGNWAFVHNDFQANGYEGIKILGFGSGGVDNLLIEGNWFEYNQTDAGRTNGYFTILSPNSYPGLITIRNNNLRGVANPWNGTTGNKMMSVAGSKVVVASNSYGALGQGAASQIEAITRANPAQVTLTNHGWATGDSILFYSITQTGGWTARLNGVSFKITKVDDHNFTIPCDTAACTAVYDPVTDPGTIRKLNVPRPWNYCGGGVLHLIGEDLDKWSFHESTKVLGDFGGWCYADYAVRTTRTTGEEALYEHIIWGKTLAGDGARIDDSTPERPRFTSGSRLGRLHIRAAGTKTGAGGNKTVKLYWGTQVIGTIGPANDTNPWVIDAWVQMTDATVQVINATTLNASTLAATRTAGSQNLANDCKVYVTGQAAVAGDTVTCHSLAIMPQ